MFGKVLHHTGRNITVTSQSRVRRHTQQGVRYSRFPTKRTSRYLGSTNIQHPSPRVDHDPLFNKVKSCQISANKISVRSSSDHLRKFQTTKQANTIVSGGVVLLLRSDVDRLRDVVGKKRVVPEVGGLFLALTPLAPA